LDIAERDVPVAEGAIKPIYSSKLPTPDFVHGKDGFGEIYLPESRRQPLKETAAEFIVRTVMDNPGEITLVVLGPMTNIALALALEPELHNNVRRVVAMGGVLAVMGNVSPVASANILGDAHAADIVLGTDWDVILVPADTTRQVRVTDEWLERVRKIGGRQGDFIFRISRFYRDFYRSGGVIDGFYNHDPTAVAYLVDESLFTTEKRAVRVVTDGISIGDVIAAKSMHYESPGPWYGIPLATITTKVDSARVMKLIEKAMTDR
jgi:inosine-uridine nucleoside N-ribohydrolase